MNEESGGNVVHRYARATGDPRVGDESTQNLDVLTAHVEKHVGPVKDVMHEMCSDYIHCDILHVAPSERRAFHTLVTSGMSDRPMNVPEGMEDVRLAEVYLCLPPEWPVSDEAFQSEANWWPVRLLKEIARMPHMFQSWLGAWHTISNGEPAVPYADGVPFRGAMLFVPLLLPEEFGEVALPGGDTIRIYSVIPLHAGEMEFKLKRGGEELLRMFDESTEMTEVIDLSRPPVA